MDPEYVSGGGGAKNIEEKVVAVFDRQFALALQQVDVKDQDQLLLGFFLICVSLQKEEELATIDERILEVRRSSGLFQNCKKKIMCLRKSNMPKKTLNWYIH